MSLETVQKNIESFNAQIAVLDEQKAGIEAVISNLQKELAQIENSITRHTSPAANKSKNTEIIRYKSDILKKSTELDSLLKKLEKLQQKKYYAEKTLQKAHSKEQLKQQKQIDFLQKQYEKIAADQKKRQKQNFQNAAVDFEVKTDCDYDVFISSAKEDMQTFAAPFAQALEAKGLKVWYNKNPSILLPGDLNKELEAGLKKAHFAILIISCDYLLPNRYWKKSDLELWFTKQIEHKLIFPVLHKISLQELTDYSPTIAKNAALCTATATPQELAEDFASILKDQN